ncbi:MAG: trypsin-like peptidase domain-containing protein, partial [Bacteroidota bacterium]
MMSQRQFFVSTVAAALLGGGIALGSHQYFHAQQAAPSLTYEPTVAQLPVQLTGLPADTHQEQEPNFVHAAQMATPAVVHIKAKREERAAPTAGTNSPLDRLLKEFFGEGFDLDPREYRSPSQQASGSGVIIAANGYIVTNNHVIDGADQIEVTLDDNRRYTAQLIGQDPDTDLALLKINEKRLAYLQFGDSDRLQVGEWILAVGNPFNLTSTVTKGIVSAKARNINILQDKSHMRIEAFIQTDAAVNPGNSGG